MRAVAKVEGLTAPAVHHIVRRDAPLLMPSDPSLTDARPWDAEGVSRAAWYRRRNRRRETSVK